MGAGDGHTIIMLNTYFVEVAEFYCRLNAPTATVFTSNTVSRFEIHKHSLTKQSGPYSHHDLINNLSVQVGYERFQVSGFYACCLSRRIIICYCLLSCV